MLEAIVSAEVGDQMLCIVACWYGIPGMELRLVLRWLALVAMGNSILCLETAGGTDANENIISTKQPFSATDTTDSHTSVPVCTGLTDLCEHCTTIHIQHVTCTAYTDLSTLCNNTHLQHVVVQFGQHSIVSLSL